MTATFIDVKTRIPNNAPLTYSQVDTNFTVLSKLCPIGAMVEYSAVDEFPDTWLECDGAKLDRGTYAELFAVIGTVWNTGEETAEEFRVPDTRGYFSRHLDTAAAIDPDGAGRTLGSIQAQEFLSHTHNSAGAEKGPSLGSGSSINYLTSGDGDTYGRQVVATGGNETRPVNKALVRIIKAIT